MSSIIVDSFASVMSIVSSVKSANKLYCETVKASQPNMSNWTCQGPSLCTDHNSEIEDGIEEILTSCFAVLLESQGALDVMTWFTFSPVSPIYLHIMPDSPYSPVSHQSPVLPDSSIPPDSPILPDSLDFTWFAYCTWFAYFTQWQRS